MNVRVPFHLGANKGASLRSHLGTYGSEPHRLPRRVTGRKEACVLFPPLVAMGERGRHGIQIEWRTVRERGGLKNEHNFKITAIFTIRQVETAGTTPVSFKKGRARAILAVSRTAAPRAPSPHTPSARPRARSLPSAPRTSLNMSLCPPASKK